MSAPLLRVANLHVSFPAGRGRALHAVQDVSFELPAGRTLGVVGESGCGKSTLARTIVRLLDVTSGAIRYAGRDVHTLRGRDLREYRRCVQMIFQDPATSLTPHLTVETLVGEALTVHGLVRSKAQRRERVIELLEQVGLSADALGRFPREFSGGQRQRIGIARALALQPRLVICDEPVSALDVSIRAQVLNLLSDLRDQHNLTYLFIAHDLDLVRWFCDDVLVMYLGRIVECAPAAELFTSPRHPYTRALLAAAPRPEPGERDRPIPGLPGELPSPLDPPAGCALHPRCPIAKPRCATERPPFDTEKSTHRAACFFASELPPFDARSAKRQPASELPTDAG